ncbi:hypothetical protein C8F01DRAFT_1259332 [Mycena amicta]|nr:hypothetical protein C8F01DRAFT_1259332 [Mycena amicta]
MGHITQDVTEDIYTALAEHLSADALRTLRVRAYHSTHWSNHLPDYVVDGAALVPLFKFTNLTEVDLQPPSAFTLTDTTIWDLARSWPEITKLTLRAASWIQPRPITTLDALRAFAMHCRKLESLCLTVDAAVPVAPALDNLMFEHRSQLGRLEFNQSPITSACVSDIARFISSLFPGIESLQASHQPIIQLVGWLGLPVEAQQEAIQQNESHWGEVWNLISGLSV